MQAKDDRLKHMNETLSGIKVSCLTEIYVIQNMADVPTF